jgi:hypothetical protein
MTGKRYLWRTYCGRRLSGTYIEHDGMVTVRSEDGEKTTQLGGSMARSLAFIMLRQLADDRFPPAISQ